MTTFELLTLIISILALIVSIFTAYKTFVTKFKPEIFMKPRIILTRINQKPAIAVGCEIANSSNKPGLIEDIMLLIKYKNEQTRGINSYTFFPIIVRADFNINKTYQVSDFEPFQAISVSANYRVVQYILFSPETNGFSPSPGKWELKILFRNFDSNKWQSFKNNTATLQIVEAQSNIWANPQGENIMIETVENYKYRDRLMDTV